MIALSRKPALFASTGARARPHGHHARYLRGLRTLVMAFALLAGAQAQASGALTVEDRVACQTALETVRWSHMIWPEANPDPKPPLSEVLPESAIRARVIDSLRMEAALGARYGARIDAAVLQTELNRMAAATRAPDQLRELYAALDNDADRIGECLARPEITRRQLRDAYVWDNDLHGALREQAQADLARAGAITSANAPTGVKAATVVYVRDESLGLDAGLGDPDADTKEIALAPDAWDARAAGFDIPIQSEAAHGLHSKTGPSPALALRETEHGFMHETLLDRDGNRLTVLVWAWPKTTFDTWWASETDHWSAITAAPMLKAALTLTPINGNGVFTSDVAKAGGDDTWRATQQSAPRARCCHTAIWTGTEMIVWGGYGNGYLDTGGRYNPVTDTWVPTATLAAPTARSAHTVVWTGSEMIVWGGIGYDDAFNSGGRYNPVTDSWTATPAMNAPEMRASHSAIWTGNEMIVWGGNCNNGLNSGGRFNPGTGTWSATPLDGAPSPRCDHTAVWTGSEMIIWGGNTQSGSTATGARFDPVTGTWSATPLAGAPDSRDWHTAVWTGNDMIVWGGVGGDNGITGGRYTPATNSWAAMAPGSAKHFHLHVAVWTGSEMIVWGGENGNFGGRYTPGTDSWTETPMAGAPKGHTGHSAVWTGNEMIVWGGRPTNAYQVNTGSRYRPATNTWTPTGAATPRGGTGHSSVWTGSEMIIWGGDDGSFWENNTGARYRPATDSWTDTDNYTSPIERRDHTAVWTGTEMLVWGGRRDTFNGEQIFDTGARYAPMTDSWTVMGPAQALSGRHGHTAVWSGAQMIVWGGVGGGDGNTPLATGGRYTPASNSWASTLTTGAPEPRLWHTAVWAGDSMLVWGGAGTEAFNNGGRYWPASNTWTALSTTGAPAGRFLHTSVWTGEEMIVWGGAAAGYTPLDTGGRYRPASNTWTATVPAAAPSPRYDHTAVWTGSEMIVWGGYGNEVLATGSRFNPAGPGSWTPMTTNGAPTARSNHTAEWTGQEMLIWGGYDGSYLNSLGAYSASGGVNPVDSIFEHDFELPDDEP